MKSHKYNTLLLAIHTPLFYSILFSGKSHLLFLSFPHIFVSFFYFEKNENTFFFVYSSLYENYIKLLSSFVQNIHKHNLHTQVVYRKSGKNGKFNENEKKNSTSNQQHDFSIRSFSLCFCSISTLVWFSFHSGFSFFLYSSDFLFN